MPTSVAEYVAGFPVTAPKLPHPEPERVYSPDVYYGENPSITEHVRPWRDGNVPARNIGGWSENVDPTNGFTIDQGFSPRNRAAFLGQGHYDLVPVPTVPTDGPGTPNTRLRALRQGALSQVMGLQRSETVTALQFASALSGYQAGLLAGR
jgi:hypothetical protein